MKKILTCTMLLVSALFVFPAFAGDAECEALIDQYVDSLPVLQEQEVALMDSVIAGTGHKATKALQASVYRSTSALRKYRKNGCSLEALVHRYNSDSYSAAEAAKRNTTGPANVILTYCMELAREDEFFDATWLEWLSLSQFDVNTRDWRAFLRSAHSRMETDGADSFAAQYLSFFTGEKFSSRTSIAKLTQQDAVDGTAKIAEYQETLLNTVRTFRTARYTAICAI
jgi:hypothetical protein